MKNRKTLWPLLLTPLPAVAVSVLLGARLIPIGYEVRGIHAIGGEHLLILLAMLFSTWGSLGLYRACCLKFKGTNSRKENVLKQSDMPIDHGKENEHENKSTEDRG